MSERSIALPCIIRRADLRLTWSTRGPATAAGRSRRTRARWRGSCGGRSRRRRAAVRELGGSGRTDAGVHALAQVAHLRACAPPVEPERFRREVNDALPPDIHLLAAARRRPTASTPATTPSCAATSTRSRAAARPSPSASSGGSSARSTSAPMGEAAARPARPARLPALLRAPGRADRARSWSSSAPRWRPTARWSSCASPPRTSSGRWCGAWPARSSRSGAARSASRSSRRSSPAAARRTPSGRRRLRGSSSSASSTPATRRSDRSGPRCRSARRLVRHAAAAVRRGQRRVRAHGALRAPHVRQSVIAGSSGTQRQQSGGLSAGVCPSGQASQRTFAQGGGGPPGRGGRLHRGVRLVSTVAAARGAGDGQQGRLRRRTSTSACSSWLLLSMISHRCRIVCPGCYPPPPWSCSTPPTSRPAKARSPPSCHPRLGGERARPARARPAAPRRPRAGALPAGEGRRADRRRHGRARLVPAGPRRAAGPGRLPPRRRGPARLSRRGAGALPVDRERLVAPGFSQGGALAYDLVLRDPARFAGLAALSSWLPAPLAAEIRSGPSTRACRSSSSTAPATRSSSRARPRVPRGRPPLRRRPHLPRARHGATRSAPRPCASSRVARREGLRRRAHADAQPAHGPGPRCPIPCATLASAPADPRPPRPRPPRPHRLEA